MPRKHLIKSTTGEIRQAQIFVGMLGASNYTYAEATASQSLPDWLNSFARMFDYFGGCPALVVRDNLRNGRRGGHSNGEYHRTATYRVGAQARTRSPAYHNSEHAYGTAGPIPPHSLALTDLRTASG